ncbi:phenazine biosynthesis FMN-dependent oxidase PhzG [Streptomyces sp. NPDC088789]|uniref:phenazine biosynthesis FMN-dependent oxidase PhzG n=1 Tax=Streptomyces sp. NPDC088789 TaxID=3365899 RepID=UPI003826FB5A
MSEHTDDARRPERTGAAASDTLTGTHTLPFPEYVTPPADPLTLLRHWLTQAVDLGVREPRALALATADAQGRPATRIVVLSDLTRTGLLFATHADSRKGRHLRANPWASGLLYWRETSRQISADGPVRRLPDSTADDLWAARPVGTHAMTVASRQSRPLADVADLRARAADLAAAGPQPRPAAYAAFELVPEQMEFWANGTDRLHERLRYDRTGDGWSATRLQP